MPTKYIIANWKMNFSKQILNGYHNLIDHPTPSYSVIVCPPHCYLPLMNFKHIAIGSQNVHEKSCGAYTGEISAEMLYDLGCRYAIIGHSERRNGYSECCNFESDKIIYEKTKHAISCGLTAIVCVGESLKDKGNFQFVLSNQLQQIATLDLSKIIIAYEPVWAIGTGLVPTNLEISNATNFIIDFCCKNEGAIGNAGSVGKKDSIKKESTIEKDDTKRIDKVDETKIESLQNKVKVVYGGSVNINNYQNILSIPGISGLLIGGQSLKVQEFSQIIKEEIDEKIK